MEDKVPVLDAQSALERLDGDVDLYKSLINDFFKIESDTIAILRNYYRTGDYESLRSRAHRMKGVLAAIGAQKMSTICMNIERMIKEDRINPSVLARLMGELPDSYTETETALKLFIAQHE